LFESEQAAVNSGQIKTGSLCRTDRVCKYNELLQGLFSTLRSNKYVIAGS